MDVEHESESKSLPIFKRQAIDFYESNYELITYIQGEDGPHVVTVPSNGYNSCRYCDRSFPEVTFKEECHALPESIGNYYLFAEDECDSCNKLFGIGGGIEDHLSKWSLPYRTISGISGKNGIPSIKREQAGWRVDASYLNLDLKMQADRMIVTINEAEDSVVIEVPRDSFVPIAVYKAFVKMAIALLPREDVARFKAIVDWLRIKKYSTLPIENSSISTDSVHIHPKLIFSNFPALPPRDYLAVVLARRTTEDLRLPYLVFGLWVANYAFQIIVPCGAELQNQDISVNYLPFLYGPDYSNPVKPQVIDLGGTEKVKNELLQFHFKFGTMQHKLTSRQEIIATRSYFLWQENGSKEGLDLDYWLQAEKEMTELR